MPIQLIMILIIVGALGLQFGAFKLQKYLNEKKLLKIQKENVDLTRENDVLKAEKEQREREQKASGDHRKRVKLSKAKVAKLEKQIDQAHTSEEIEAIMTLIDADNNFRIRK